MINLKEMRKIVEKIFEKANSFIGILMKMKVKNFYQKDD